MCASYGLQTKPDQATFPIFDEKRVDEGVAKWLQAMPDVIRPTGPKALNFAPIITPEQVELAWWGMWVGNQPGKFSTINAKIENLTKGLWKSPLAKGRILIPGSHYFEYRAEGGPKKTRYRFTLPDEAPFMFAGLAAPIFGEGLPALSYTMVTREPTETASEIHNRMPMLLPDSFHDDWLDPASVGDESLVGAALAASEEIVQQLTFEPA